MTTDLNAAAPIGIFDSGVGGLSVLRALQAQLPHETFIYYADTAFCPYGERDVPTICARAEAISTELIAAGAKVIVVACNTATIAAIAHLRARFDVPFVGMEPGVKPAAAASRSGHVGVLATTRSLAGERFQALVDAHARGTTVHTRACSGWVERVEAGDVASVDCVAMLRRDVQPLIDAQCDVLVLGCTHFPFLATTLRDIVGPKITLLDTGPAVARQAERVLAAAGALNPTGSGGGVMWRCSGSPAVFERQRQTLGFATP
jgi:glutamate racemase